MAKVTGAIAGGAAASEPRARGVETCSGTPAEVYTACVTALASIAAIPLILPRSDATMGADYALALTKMSADAMAEDRATGLLRCPLLAVRAVLTVRAACKTLLDEAPTLLPAAAQPAAAFFEEAASMYTRVAWPSPTPPSPSYWPSAGDAPPPPVWRGGGVADLGRAVCGMLATLGAVVAAEYPAPPGPHPVQMLATTFLMVGAGTTAREGMPSPLKPGMMPGCAPS